MASAPLILDRYRVVGQAGSGGYGTVVHAFDTHLKRDVAIKCIELSEDEVARARLVALEARMAADLEDAGSGASDVVSAPGVVSGDHTVSSHGFPADPDFLRARDERRAARAAESARSVRPSDEIPPWEDAPDFPASAVAGSEGDSLVPWGSGAGGFATRGASVGADGRIGRTAPRKTRHAPEAFSEPIVEVQEAAPLSDTIDEAAVDVRHLRGIRPLAHHRRRHGEAPTSRGRRARRRRFGCRCAGGSVLGACFGRRCRGIRAFAFRGRALGRFR